MSKSLKAYEKKPLERIKDENFKSFWHENRVNVENAMLLLKVDIRTVNGWKKNKYWFMNKLAKKNSQEWKIN